MTTTMSELRGVVEKLEEKGKREKVKVMVGGAPVTGEYARYIHADGYAPDAISAPKTADRLMKGEKYYGEEEE
jgi:5-methyltetrahydrofolate--homocysteine methyltransferase